jgi:hypothetical protein
VVNCVGQPIQIPYLGANITRDNMVRIVITCDMLIVFGFLIGIGMLDYHINREAEEIDFNDI